MEEVKKRKLSNKKCLCGARLYPHGKFLNKDNHLMQGYICPLCGSPDSVDTNIKVKFTEPENPFCPSCKCKMQKWGKRYRESTQSVMRSFRCNSCGSCTSIEVPCQIIKIGKRNEKN